MKKIYFIIFSTIIFFSLSGYSQDVKFTARSKKVVAMGETFQLIYSVNANASRFQQPNLSNFNFSGPSTSTQMSSSFVNGQMTQSVENSYTYYMQAKKPGKFNVGPAKIKVGGKVYASNSVSIEVVKGNNSNKSGNNSNNSSSNVKSNNDEIFIRVNLNKSSAFQGEHIIATVKIYTQLDLYDFENMKFPSYNGFWSQDIETPTNISLQREKVGGKIYNTGVLKKTLLFPQRSGELKIEPFKLTCIVRQLTGRRSFWGPETQRVKMELKSPVKKIKVKPLPGNKPESFTGAVGTFKMDASIDKRNVKTNDAITLKLKISGNGNLKITDPFKINFPPDFETYDPKIANNIKNTNGGASGTKTYEYLMIPRHAGEFTIPPVEFSYFDTKTKSYKTLSSPEYKINVEKSEGDETSTPIITNSRKENLKMIGKDIRFIKTDDFEIVKKDNVLFGSAKFYLIYLSSILLFVIIFVLRRNKIKQSANISLVKNKRARKISAKRLKTAKLHLTQNENEKFYEELLKATWGYLSDKLDIPVSELSKDNAMENLNKYSVDENTIAKLAKVIDTCEFARYAPSAKESEMSEIYEDASGLISELESKLK